MRVLFLQTAHMQDDDRVNYHQRVNLERAGLSCAFAASPVEEKECPDVVICDTPKAIWESRKAFKQRAKIIYDITEWYPSKKNLRNEPRWLRPFKWCVLVLANFYAGCAADAFIFGEEYKAKPFRTLFPRKHALDLPYYPSLQYIHPTIPSEIKEKVRLFYAGPQTKEKGYHRVQLVAQRCQSKLPDKDIVLTEISQVPFEEFCSVITQADFFLDLRDDDVENTHCLPIKLFYYMAAGRPVIYSDLKAIRHGVPEIAEDSLVKPGDITRAADMICDYVNHPDRYRQIGKRNRDLIEQKYNWEIQNTRFVQFVTHSSASPRTDEPTT